LRLETGSIPNAHTQTLFGDELAVHWLDRFGL
jgi:hypothetical protein